MIGGKDKDIQVQRRDRVGGGLNSRSSPYLLEESQQIDLKNMDFLEEGALKQRRFSTQLIQTTWAGAGLLPAPVVAVLAGGGAMPADGVGYNIRYWLSHFDGGIVDYTSPSATAVTGPVALNDRIQIDIPPNNLGEGVGSGAEGGDDPFNGGVIGPALVIPDTNFITVLVQKTGDPNFTRQTLSTAFAWNIAGRVQRGILSAYAITTTLADSDDPFPLRFIVWHPGIQRLLGITVDKAVAFAGDFSSFTRFGLANDKAGNPHFWSRVGTRMQSSFVDDIMVIGDNISRPKRLHWTGSIATSNWRLIGANVPASAPTAVINPIAGALGIGTYSYKVAFVYRDSLPNLTTLDIESNETIASNVVTTIAGQQQIDVTIPGTPETGLFARRVYRTKVNGSVFFARPIDEAAGSGNLTFTDNTADAALGISTPVNDVGKIGNDVPPNRLAFNVAHANRTFAFVANYIVDSSNRIIDFLATNIGRFTKAPSSGTSEAVNAWPAVFQIECGDSSPVTGAVSFRGALTVFKADCIGAISGSDETDFQYNEVLPNTGSMRFSQIAVGLLVYFWEDARGPLVFDGTGVTQIGYEIQRTWLVDRATGFYPVCVWYDPERYEVHWSMIRQNMSPPLAVSAAMFHKEYVFSIPTKSWCTNTSESPAVRTQGRSVTSADRVVLTTDIGSQKHTQVLATWRGRVQREAATGDRIPQADVDRGDGVVQFKFFFGESWESVKTPRVIVLESFMPALCNVFVAMGLSNEGTLYSVATLTGNVNRLGQRVDYIDIPADLFVNNQDVALGKLSQDRGLTVQLQVQNSDANNEFTIRGISWHFKEASDVRRFP